jgi:ribonuclease-3
MTGDPLSETEEIIKYNFGNSDLLETALTHSSSINEESTGKDYERLEFLGDAVLELVTREYLLTEYPDESEGDLTRRKIRIVQKGNLSKHGRRLGLDRRVHTGRGFVSSGSAIESIAADVIESLIGAIYIDSGLESAKEFVTREILERSIDNGPLPDARSRLQEYCQAKGMKLPEYKITGRRGPDHSPVFTVTVSIAGKEAETGIGLTRKAAREKAAEKALEKLERKV